MDDSALWINTQCTSTPFQMPLFLVVLYFYPSFLVTLTQLIAYLYKGLFMILFYTLYIYAIENERISALKSDVLYKGIVK